MVAILENKMAAKIVETWGAGTQWLLNISRQGVACFEGNVMFCILTEIIYNSPDMSLWWGLRYYLDICPTFWKMEKKNKSFRFWYWDIFFQPTYFCICLPVYENMVHTQFKEWNWMTFPYTFQVFLNTFL